MAPVEERERVGVGAGALDQLAIAERGEVGGVPCECRDAPGRPLRLAQGHQRPVYTRARLECSTCSPAASTARTR